MIDIRTLKEFDNHHLFVKIEEPEKQLIGFIAIHKKNTPYPSLGATRLWVYKNETEAIRDVLRLSRLMSYKSVFAGLPYGGAKGVIMQPQKKFDRTDLFQAYTNKVNELNGEFITGTDVGLDEKDLQIMSSFSNYIIGSGVDAAFYTALGVFSGIKIYLKNIFGSANVRNRSFAIQGLGKTGLALLGLLLDNNAKGPIFITDIDPVKAQYVSSLKRKNITFTSPESIYKVKVDVFSPCALSGSINRFTAKILDCKIIAGSANNQLEDDAIGTFLYERGIFYAPDYIINAGGLISVADEYEHSGHNHDRVVSKLNKIEESLNDVLVRSITLKTNSNIVADMIGHNLLMKKTYAVIPGK